MIWLLPHPSPSPVSKIELADGRGGRERSQIIRRRESLILFKSFNSLISKLALLVMKVTFLNIESKLFLHGNVKLNVFRNLRSHPQPPILLQDTKKRTVCSKMLKYLALRKPLHRGNKKPNNYLTNFGKQKKVKHYCSTFFVHCSVKKSKRIKLRKKGRGRI
jgi:hypothetical protein